MSERRKTSSCVCVVAENSKSNEHESCWSPPIHKETEERKRSYHGVTGMEAWPPPKSLYWDYATPAAGRACNLAISPLRSHAQPHSATQVSSFHSPGLQVSASSST